MIFSIVIPAYNEEDAIEAVARRALSARGAIMAATPVDEVEIIVVSDGSTDRTVEIAARYATEIVRLADNGTERESSEKGPALAGPGLRLIHYTKNRGFGAALKAGCAQARGELIGTLDADDTYDPLDFPALLNQTLDDNLDLAIGGRMNSAEMTSLRRLGNQAFATLINRLCGANITDATSGMRVIRQSALARLAPLPDGLHLAPAMTAKAILDPTLRVGEAPIRYYPRKGRSKLHPATDGWRFAWAILAAVLNDRRRRARG